MVDYMETVPKLIRSNNNTNDVISMVDACFIKH